MKAFRFIQKYFWVTAFFGWSILIVVFSILPGSSIIEKSNDESNFRWDYVEHFTVFVIFAILFAAWRRKNSGTALKKVILRFLIPGVIYAIATETLQLFVVARTFNPIDIYFNIGGLITGTMIAWIFIFNKLKSSLKKAKTI